MEKKRKNIGIIFCGKEKYKDFRFPQSFVKQKYKYLNKI